MVNFNINVLTYKVNESQLKVLNHEVQTNKPLYLVIRVFLKY